VNPPKIAEIVAEIEAIDRAINMIEEARKELEVGIDFYRFYNKDYDIPLRGAYTESGKLDHAQKKLIEESRARLQELLKQVVESESWDDDGADDKQAG